MLQLMALPTFFEPLPASDPIWDRLARGGDIVDIAVFDDMDELAGVKQQMDRARIPTFGYVSTRTGTVLPEVYGPIIDGWFNRFHNLRGMFVDEGPPANPGDPAEHEPQYILDYYTAVYEKIKSRNRGANVMLNCAGCRDAAVLDRCDSALIVEQDFTQYANPSWWDGASRPWWTSPPIHKYLGHTVHSAATSADMQVALSLAQDRKAHWAYVTDGSSSAYNRLPTYWEEELQVCRGHGHSTDGTKP